MFFYASECRDFYVIVIIAYVIAYVKLLFYSMHKSHKFFP